MIFTHTCSFIWSISGRFLWQCAEKLAFTSAKCHIKSHFETMRLNRLLGMMCPRNNFCSSFHKMFKGWGAGRGGKTSFKKLQNLYGLMVMASNWQNYLDTFSNLYATLHLDLINCQSDTYNQNISNETYKVSEFISVSSLWADVSD